MQNLPTPEEVRHLLRSRSSIHPPMYTQAPIDKAIIDDILENANWAPNHKQTEPWRFRVFRGDARQQVADFMVDTYKATTPEENISEAVIKKFGSNPLKADTLIFICMQRDAKESLPEWEELSAVAMAVQNIWLSATAYGLGGFWSSPGVITKHADKLFPMAEGERCYGMFYLAHHNAPELQRSRQPIADKVTWFE